MSTSSLVGVAVTALAGVVGALVGDQGCRAAEAGMAQAAHPAAPVPAVQLDGSRCIRAQGKPFFAIGMYSVGVADLPLLAEAGFNVVHTYGWEGKADHDWGLEWLDAVQAHGLKALVGFYRPQIKGMDFPESVRRIEMYRNHQALLAWHTMDEPAWDKEGNRGKDYMPSVYGICRQHDPGHPVTAVICHFADNKLFESSVDIMQADYYPIPPLPAINFSGTGFSGIAHHVELWREACQDRKPFWFVCQAFDYARMRQDQDIPPEWQRFPTQQELRTMTYTAVAAGARGVFYWSLSRLRSEVRDGGPTADEYFARLRSVTRELHELSPMLTVATPETFIRRDSVVALVKSDGHCTYIIAANCERQPTRTVLDVPGVTKATAEIVFGEGTASIEGGKLALSLDSIESRVYRVRNAE
jgi:hypothetical protein